MVKRRVHGSTTNYHYKWLYIAFVIISFRIERKYLKKWFKSFEYLSKNILWKFSGRALIGQNDLLDVLLLEFLIFTSKYLRYIDDRVTKLSCREVDDDDSSSCSLWTSSSSSASTFLNEQILKRKKWKTIREIIIELCNK